MCTESKVEQEEIRRGTLHFSVGSEFGDLMTEEARQIAWYENNENKAIVFLIDSFGGMNVVQAKDIIKGRKKLVTTKDGSSCELVIDNWNPPLEEIEEAKEKIAEALAFIGQLPNALREYLKYPTTERPTGGAWYEHLYNPVVRKQLEIQAAEVIAYYDSGKIWRARSAAMQLHQFSYIAMKANAEFYRERLDTHKSKKSKFKELSENPKTKATLFERLREDAMTKIATSDLDEETKRRLLLVADGQFDAYEGKVELKEDTQFDFDTGWLSPEGTYYGCKPGQHDNLSDIIRQRFYPTDTSKHSSRKVLELAGWIPVTGGKWYYYQRKGLSPEQIATIKKWSKAIGGPLVWNDKKRTVSEIARYRGLIDNL